jgi:phosphoglycerate dehydrogenase-like enzyme
VSGDALTVVIASPLEPELVERVGAVDGRLRVVFEPELLPVPRYEGDHIGVARDLDPEELGRWSALLAKADVMFDFDWLGASTLPQRAPRLRWLQATSAGIGEMVERSGLLGSSIEFTTAAGVHASALAEFALLGLLYWTKDVPFLERRQAERHWERHTAESLAGRRVLVVGLGEVGREIARACDAIGLEVWGMRRSAQGEPPPGVRRLVDRPSLRGALAAVDALVLACPLTRETHHLIGAEELAALRPSAILVNVARGAVIDEPALIRALERGAIRGAALDVFEHEPLPGDNPLWGLPNVLVSPHSASTVGGENAKIVEIFTDNLRRFLDGRPLRNRFEPDRGY